VTNSEAVLYFPAFTYIDGVPVKIAEQYKPPRKVTLPVSYQHRLSIETVTEEVRYLHSHLYCSPEK
jgi:hypothetical protein